MEQRLPRGVLTAREAEAILALPDIREPVGLRDRTLLEVFYATGIRRAELMRLGAFDVDFERLTLLVRQGKGRKDRMIPVGERAAAWVEKYLSDARPDLVLGADDGTMFLTTAGDPFTPNRLTQLVRGYVDRADIGKRGSCLLLRHTMATLMLEGGADIRYIQAILGHVSLETTQIYTQVSVRTLMKVHSATHPGASLKRKAPDEDEGEGVEGAATEGELLAELEAERVDEGEDGPGAG